MQRPEIPDAIRGLADARQDARNARDFSEADRLKAEIEAAGWALTDQAHSYRLHRAYPADIRESDGRIRYGSSRAVPSRVSDPPRGAASIVVVAPDDPDVLERTLAMLAAVPDDVQRIVVANAPDPETRTLLTTLARHWAAETSAADLDTAVAGGGEVVWMVERVAAAAALNAGIRRAAADVVILLDAGAEAMGGFVAPLVTALDDRTVAIAGPWGLVSDDLRLFDPVSVADAGERDVAAISFVAMAFRRADYGARGPLDERFVEPPLLDAWWSLVLRDPGEEETVPRRAVLVDVPLVRRDADEGAADVRVVRRNRYRIIDRFGNRRDLAVARDQ